MVLKSNKFIIKKKCVLIFLKVFIIWNKKKYEGLEWNMIKVFELLVISCRVYWVIWCYDGSDCYNFLWFDYFFE